MASEQHSGSTEPEGMYNPFIRHAECDHAPPVYKIQPTAKGPALDLLKFLALVDSFLQTGNIESARAYVWSLGAYLDLCVTGHGDYAAAVLEIARAEVERETDEELRRMVDGE